jgi:hypothetical protein
MNILFSVFYEAIHTLCYDEPLKLSSGAGPTAVVAGLRAFVIGVSKKQAYNLLVPLRDPGDIDGEGREFLFHLNHFKVRHS